MSQITVYTKPPVRAMHRHIPRLDRAGIEFTVVDITKRLYVS
jgi:hypothetical protein